MTESDLVWNEVLRSRSLRIRRADCPQLFAFLSHEASSSWLADLWTCRSAVPSAVVACVMWIGLWHDIVLVRPCYKTKKGCQVLFYMANALHSRFYWSLRPRPISISSGGVLPHNCCCVGIDVPGHSTLKSLYQQQLLSAAKTEMAYCTAIR